MEELGLPVPRTLVLKDLLALLRPHHPSLSRFRPALTILTRFGLNTHYHGDSATKRQAKTALRWAERVRAACHALLGIPPPRPRRQKAP